MKPYRLIQGDQPLLISMPHIGTFVPPDIKQRLADAAKGLPDTDWHVDSLYDFAEDMGASMLFATHSRYVVDLNRSPEDTDLYPGQVKTGFCPMETFDGQAIYQTGEEPDHIEMINREGAYWLPYHEALQGELARIKEQHGRAVLYDAHSIRSQVPRLFDGQLPDLNIGTNNGATCAPELEQAVLEAAGTGGYSAVLNGRFIGGYITRTYGDPANNTHAIQMELAQINYMDEVIFTYQPEKAEELKVVLKNCIEEILRYLD